MTPQEKRESIEQLQVHVAHDDVWMPRRFAILVVVVAVCTILTIFPDLAQMILPTETEVGTIARKLAIVLTPIPIGIRLLYFYTRYDAAKAVLSDYDNGKAQVVLRAYNRHHGRES